MLAALRDDVRFSNRMGVSIDPSAWSPDAHLAMSFLALDGTEQSRLRSLVSRAFTPRRVRELVPRLQELADHYLDDALVDGGSCDWIADVAGRLPMDVISEMMGVPEADRAEVRRQADLVVHREEGVFDVPPAGAETGLWLMSYYAEMVAARRRQPRDDLTSALIAADLDGDRLQDHEVMAFLFLMVVAGNETTTKLLGNAVHHLHRHPAQQAHVFADRHDLTLVGPWIEETLRYDTSSQMIARLATVDVTIDGITAPAGSRIVLLLGSANRDPDVFAAPDAYTLDRDPEEWRLGLSFGSGRHFCLGATLARLEARVVLSELVRRVRTNEIDDGAAVRVHSTNVRGFAALPMTVRLR